MYFLIEVSLVLIGVGGRLITKQLFKKDLVGEFGINKLFFYLLTSLKLGIDEIEILDRL